MNSMVAQAQMSYSPILINSSRYVADTNMFRLQLSRTMSLDANSKLLFLSSTIYNSFFNISQAMGNNYFYLLLHSTKIGIPFNSIPASFSPVIWSSNNSYYRVTITFPDGFYTIAQINTFLQTQFRNLGLYLVGNTSTIAEGTSYFYMEAISDITNYTFQLVFHPVCSQTNYSAGTCLLTNSVIFTPPSPTSADIIYTLFPSATTANYGSFATILGFADGAQVPSITTYSTAYSTSGRVNADVLVNSTQTPRISPISSIIVGCNLVYNRNIPINPTNFVTMIPINSEFATQLQYQQNNNIFLSCYQGNFDNITISLYDNYGNPLAINDPDCTFNLLLCQCG